MHLCFRHLNTQAFLFIRAVCRNTLSLTRFCTEPVGADAECNLYEYPKCGFITAIPAATKSHIGV